MIYDNGAREQVVVDAEGKKVLEIVMRVVLGEQAKVVWGAC